MDPSEGIVGLLDAERFQGAKITVTELRERPDTVAAAFVALVTDAQLDAVRARRAELFAMWEALPPGETLELPFDRRG